MPSSPAFGSVWRREALDDVGGSGLTSLKTCSPGLMRCAVVGAGLHPDSGCGLATRTRGHPERLQTARDLGARHDSPLAVGNFRGLGIRQYLSSWSGLYYLQCFGTIALIYATLVTLFFHIHH